MGYSGPIRTNPPTGEAAIWLFGYVPSLAMGIVGVITMLLVAGPHAFYLFTKRGVRSVHLLFAFAAAIEALGFGARLYSNTWEFDGMGFLVGLSLIQLATVLLTAGLYKSVQRNAKYFPVPVGMQLSPMRPRSMLSLFIILDVIFVLFQIGGQYLASSAQAAEFTGTEPMFSVGTSTLIFLSGNVLQAISIIVFAAFVLVIKKRVNRVLSSADPATDYPLSQALLTQILISVGLFLIRLIVRIAQGAQGIYGYAATHEWVFGVFEYLLIFLILVLWAVKPLHSFLFPLGHRHGEGAHTRIHPGDSVAPSSSGNIADKA